MQPTPQVGTLSSKVTNGQPRKYKKQKIWYWSHSWLITIYYNVDPTRVW